MHEKTFRIIEMVCQRVSYKYHQCILTPTRVNRNAHVGTVQEDARSAAVTQQMTMLYIEIIRSGLLVLADRFS